MVTLAVTALVVAALAAAAEATLTVELAHVAAAVDHVAHAVAVAFSEEAED